MPCPAIYTTDFFSNLLKKCSLKRNVVILKLLHRRTHRAFGRALRSGIAVLLTIVEIRGATPATPHELQAITNDLRGIPLLAFLVGPFARLQASLDVRHTAFFQIFTSDLRGTPKQHHAVPFRALLAIALAILEGFGRGQIEVGNGPAAGLITHLGVTPQVPE